MKAEGGLCYPSLDICVNYPLSTVTKFSHNVKAMNLGKYQNQYIWGDVAMETIV